MTGVACFHIPVATSFDTVIVINGYQGLSNSQFYMDRLPYIMISQLGFVDLKHEARYSVFYLHYIMQSRLP